MIKLYALLLLASLIGLHVAPPVNKEEAAAEQEEDKKELTEHEKQDQEYYRYLTEIVGELEKDEEFSKHIANVSEEDIKSGQIAHVLKKVKSEIRDKLDVIKRREVERTLELIRLQKKHVLADTNGDAGHRVKSWHPAHDYNKDTFEVEDIKKLLKKHHDMMDETDRRRKDDFKDYEMEKEHKRRGQMKNMTADERTQEDVKHKEEIKNRQKHEPMHEPGHKKELEEVWEKEDGLDPDSYDPKTFFALHDKDGNGYLDNFELATFFLTDLDKTYNESDPNVDPKERSEEMERMREHVMKEMDKDSDGLVSREEFLTESGEENFEEDEEWKPLTDDEQYTEDELAEFEKEYEDEEGGYGDYDHEAPPPMKHDDTPAAVHEDALPAVQEDAALPPP